MERKPLAAINVTPLVDVLLILLVVLMLALPLYAKRMPVNLPQTSLDAAPAAKMTLKVGIQKDGSFLMGEKPAAEPEILAAVTSSTSVEIYPDSAASYSSIAHLVDDIQAKSPADIALVTR